ncbi:MULTISPECIES: hypothetical protein [unclassified Microbacterium]|uniref:hypothetical protein n=1 Tax=unclassified Microbacterium TaxID=2609290 RepID=UPI0030177D26
MSTENRNRRPRRPAKTPSNPRGLDLDPRHGDLPGYQARGNAQRARLQAASADYADVAAQLQHGLARVEEQFGFAFAADDARRATQERLAQTARPEALRQAEERRLRRG